MIYYIICTPINKKHALHAYKAKKGIIRDVQINR